MGFSVKPYLNITGLYLARGWVLWFLRNRKAQGFGLLVWGAAFAVMPLMSYQVGAAPAPVQPKPAPAAVVIEVAPPAPAAPVVQQAVAAAQPKPAVQAFSYGRYNGYAYGNCTYYAANRRNIPRNWGNARNWLWAARQAGFATGTEPRVGAIAWTSLGYFGHVAIVEEVSGGMVRVSEMNYSGWNRITSRWTTTSSFQYIY
jgi:surface antigen